MFDEQLAEMETSLSAERNLKQELSHDREELATKLREIEEKLTIERDELRSELDELNVLLKVSQQKCFDLEQSLTSERSDKDTILNEKETLSCRLVDLDLMLETMNKEMKVKEDSIVSIQVLRARERERESCLLYTSPSPRDATLSRMPSSA